MFLIFIGNDWSHIWWIDFSGLMLTWSTHIFYIWLFLSLGRICSLTTKFPILCKRRIKILINVKNRVDTLFSLMIALFVWSDLLLLLLIFFPFHKFFKLILWKFNLTWIFCFNTRNLNIFIIINKKVLMRSFDHFKDNPFFFKISTLISCIQWLLIFQFK